MVYNSKVLPKVLGTWKIVYLYVLKTQHLALRIGCKKLKIWDILYNWKTNDRKKVFSLQIGLNTGLNSLSSRWNTYCMQVNSNRLYIKRNTFWTNILNLRVQKAYNGKLNSRNHEVLINSIYRIWKAYLYLNATSIKKIKINLSIVKW